MLPRSLAGAGVGKYCSNGPMVRCHISPWYPPLAAVQLICHCCSAFCCTLYGSSSSGWLADATP